MARGQKRRGDGGGDDVYKQLKRRVLAEVRRDGAAAMTRVYGGMSLAQERAFLQQLEDVKVEVAHIKASLTSLPRTVAAHVVGKLCEGSATAPVDTDGILRDVGTMASEMCDRLLGRLNDLRPLVQPPQRSDIDNQDDVEPRTPVSNKGRDPKVKAEPSNEHREATAIKEEAPSPSIKTEQTCVKAEVSHTQADDPVSEWKTWKWTGVPGDHFVPEGWEFPARLSAKQMWNLWQFGDRSTGIRPYKQLRPKLDVQFTHAMRHCRAKAVMEYLEKTVRELMPDSIATAVSDMAISDADALFTRAYEALLSRLYAISAPRRPYEIACGTLYTRLREAGKKAKA